MGQVHSHFERPIGFWRRHKFKAARREPSQASFVRMSPPPPEVSHPSAQTNQPFVHAEQSSTTTNMTPVPAAPFADMHGDIIMEETNGEVGETGNVDKVERQINSPPDQPMTDTNKPDAPIQAAGDSTPIRPTLKREHTPPHHIRIWTAKAWEIERAYGNVHDHVTKTLNKIRKQQQESSRKSTAARQTELDVYKAADSCKLALEYLVGNFSTKFFHYAGPESIMGMMAMIDADATACDDLRLKQIQMVNYGYNLAKKIAQMEGRIRELAELAKRIRDGDPNGREEGEVDADGDTDPAVVKEKDKEGRISL